MLLLLSTCDMAVLGLQVNHIPKGNLVPVVCSMSWHNLAYYISHDYKIYPGSIE